MSEAASIVVQVPLAIRRCPGRKALVTPEGATAAPRARTGADQALVKVLARAYRLQRMLQEGRYASISEMAAAGKLDRGYLGRVLQPTLLAPDIVEYILDGRLPAELGPLTLMGPFPPEWDAQRTALAGAPAPA